MDKVDAYFMKKYNMMYRMLRDTISELDPNVATTEEMEIAFETLPKQFEQLKKIWVAWQNREIELKD